MYTHQTPRPPWLTSHKQRFKERQWCVGSRYAASHVPKATRRLKMLPNPFWCLCSFPITPICVRFLWHIKCTMILCCSAEVPKAEAIEFLQSLPDDDGFCAISVTMNTHDHAAILGTHYTFMIALAHEKVGLYEGAVRFADLACGPKSRGGTPYIWSQVVALHCKGTSK